MLRFVLQSGAAGRGARRAEHPFVVGLRTGQVVPHQGGHWPNTPPNTIAAYELAAPRTQILDVDVWLTADEVLVCSHDDEIEPDVRISETTWPELEATSPVPRFVDVAAKFPDHRLNVELKDARGLIPLRDLMADGELASRSCISTFSPLLARALAGAIPNAAHARPTARRAGRIWGKGDIVQTMTFAPDVAQNQYGPLVLRLLLTAGTPEQVKRQIPIAAKKGLPIFAWTVNDETPLRELTNAGIDAVLSDNPDLFDSPSAGSDRK